MLKFVQNWFTPRVNPIGVDFGSDCLRLVQVQLVGNEHRLVAAASTDVPSHIRQNQSARLSFFVDATRDMLAQSNFRTRQAVLALPASAMHMQHLRMAKMDDAETKKALLWEAQGKLPIDPAQALMRHLIAGEVYQEQEPRNEVIVMAAARELVNQLLAAAAKAKLDVIGMNVEPKAVIDCFTHVYRRQVDRDSTTMFLDLGCGASRAIIARGEQICFARAIPIGGDHLNKATADALKISFDEAKLLRIKLCAAQSSQDEKRPQQTVHAPEPSLEDSFPVLGAALQAQSHPATAAPTVRTEPPRTATLADHAQQVEQACRESVSRLVEELDLCRRYYESTFAGNPVDRIVFIGGEARHRSLCQQIAKQLGLAAQLGDPMARMVRVSDIGIESGIDRRQPQPSWAVALGLSLGPTSAMQPSVAAVSGAS